jgi:hypothetical protein
VIKFHAVLLDETRCEFGADTEANTKAEAYEWFRDNYPESKVVQLESCEEADQREAAMHAHIARGGDWDDEGRPIYHYDYDDEWDEY